MGAAMGCGCNQRGKMIGLAARKVAQGNTQAVKPIVNRIVRSTSNDLSRIKAALGLKRR